MLLGTLLIFVNCYWIIEVEGIWHTNHATAMSLFWNTVFFLLLMVLVNIFVLKRFFPRKAFTQGELITCYVMMTIGSALAGHDSLQLGIPAVEGFPVWFQHEQPSLGWDAFTRYFPKWAMVKDINVLRPLYEGLGSQLLYTRAAWDAWAAPVAIWCLFILALGTVMICLNVILRKQWMDNERLSYPIIQLPMALSEGGGRLEFFRNRPLWIGIALAASLDLYNGIATLYHTLPLIVVRHDAPGRDLGALFTAPPWNAVGWLPLPLYPFLIALGYFLPLDLSFSIWFFFLFKKALLVLAAAIGTQPGQLSSFPYLGQQAFGAWFAIVVASLWTARHHLHAVWVKAVHPASSQLSDHDEPLSYRTALIGIAAGGLFLTWFCMRAGMSLPIILGYFGFFFLLSIAITRVRAELGPPAHEMAGNMNGSFLLTLFAGTGGVGMQALSMMGMFWWFSGRGYRSNAMPCQLEAMKMSRQAGVSMRGMGGAMMLAMLVGGIASFWAALHLQYGAGVNVMTDHNWPQFQYLKSWSSSPLRPDFWGQIWLGVGFLAAMGMMLMRLRYDWWPFHPAGYAISLNFGAEYYWSCLLIASVVKYFVLRYGGYKLNRKVMPFMFGVILGEYGVGAFWSLLSVLLNHGRYINIRTYDFAPG
ncbi:MAG: hypothetical protein KGJ62_07105 [Armatimonadetes bacterium]|nr:hypothetical protein [Armatimonadota bacterium]MDE2207298.1 hypothetical protein [Armatimonadota bacterium]